MGYSTRPFGRGALVIVVSAAAFTIEAGAQDRSGDVAPGPPTSVWAGADLNGDGKITMDEAHRQADKEAREAFAKFDKDGGGQVSLEEVPDKPNWIQAFNNLDSDGNGGLSFEEARRYFELRIEKRFALSDENSDGLLTSAELTPKGPTSTIDRVMRRDLDGNGLLSMAELAGKGDVSYFEDLHLRADTDGDGRVSRTELANEYRRRAMLMDADDDGGVTLAEYTAGMGEAARAAATLTFDELDRNDDGQVTEVDVLGKRQQ